MFFRGTKQYSGHVYYSTMSPWRAPQIATANIMEVGNPKNVNHSYSLTIFWALELSSSAHCRAGSWVEPRETAAVERMPHKAGVDFSDLPFTNQTWQCQWEIPELNGDLDGKGNVQMEDFSIDMVGYWRVSTLLLSRTSCIPPMMFLMLYKLSCSPTKPRSRQSEKEKPQLVVS